MSDCTPDWGFDRILRTETSRNGNRVYRVDWQCACGKTYRYRDYFDPPSTRTDWAKTEAWHQFMTHKFGPEWTEADTFNRVWADCFPRPKRTLHPLIIAGLLLVIAGLVLVVIL